MTEGKMIAVVGTGAILPDAFDVPTFWKNILDAKYSIRDLPEGRWDLRLYFDPDPKAIDKTYTKIGAFVEGYKFDPFKMGLIIPPKLLTTLDPVQQWTIAATHQAMTDYGYPNKPMDLDRVAVVFGNSNAGEYHYNSTFRIRLPEYQNYLAKNPAFAQLPADVQQSILKGVQDSVWNDHAVITEDTMPGELANIIPGRVANVFNFTGPNYVTDAACASSLAAISSACEGLLAHRYDVAFSGGSDRSMGVESYIKFCKIGALSVDGSRPYAEGANGFVMGEGTVVFMLKRLEDA
ncbi:MAG TPA: beta-ketoacyl synthase N-terminal-like domain-containing protein, partial [Bellilinea sp.]|nr:beta-ketoacyl synthase N-terminal-like domain-containing protein [Bellilinea sp.]